MRFYAHIVFLLAFNSIAFHAYSQLTVTPSANATALAQSLAGSGVTVSGATMNCPANAAGTFNGAASNLNIASGVLLTTGQVSDAVGPNNNTGQGIDNLATYVDPQLTAIEPQAIYNTCILEFNAVPSCSTLAFTFSFGSEEYMEWVSAGFNDVFAIFVTGPNPSGPAYTNYNMALIPATTTPVSIDNVNLGMNPAYYFDNETPPGATVQYDGFTVPIAVTLTVSPCASYHFKLAIADAGDGIVDSGVFFALQSLVCNPSSITLATSSTPAACTSSNGTATVNASGGNPPYTYTWSTTPPQTTPTATGLAPGTYTILVVDATGCFSNTSTVTVTNTGGFTTTSNQNNVTCFGANNASAAVTPAGGTAPYTYAWSTNPVQTSPTISGVSAGNYTCLVTDATGCTQTATFTITQPPAITGSITGSTNVTCFGLSNGSATASGAGGTGTINYSWNTVPAQSNATANNLAAGTYIVTISDANNCTTTQSVVITQPPGMALTTISTPSSCGVNDGTASVTSSGGATPYTYLWLTNPVQATPTATGLAAGSYGIIVSDANGCTAQQSVTVGGGTMPVADFNFTPDASVSLLDPLVLFFDGSTGNPTIWNWDFDDTASGANNTSNIQHPTHVYSDTGMYCITLIISDPSGICRDTMVKCLRVEAPFTFYIPNAFTPNEDAWNQMFKGEGTYIKEFNLMIFDRWGNKIFESNDITKGWNGKVKARTGNLVQEDVYVWKVEITDIYDKPHKYIGHVSMIR